MQVLKFLLVCSLVSLSSARAAEVTLKCGENAELSGLQSGNFSVDFTANDKGNAIENLEYSRIVRVALASNVDPYALLALYLFDKSNMKVSGLAVARTMGCNYRVKNDIKHFSSKDMESLNGAREKLRQLSSERSRIRGGEDLEEWQDLQKEVEKFRRSNEELKIKSSKLTGDKKAEVQDQITDNNEEIKGLQKEQEEYAKTPEMKKIISLELQKSSIKQQLEGLRASAMQGAGEAERAEISREFECLRSEECLGILLGNEKPLNLDLSANSSEFSESKVCLAGDSIGRGAADMSKPTGTCCAQVKIAKNDKATVALSLAAAAQSLRDHFQSCQSRPAENDCFAKYLEFKGECAHAQGTQVAQALVSDLFTKADVNLLIAREAKALNKKVLSSFCVGQKKQSVVVTDKVFAEEYKKFVAVHKSCGKKERAK